MNSAGILKAARENKIIKKRLRDQGWVDAESKHFVPLRWKSTIHACCSACLFVIANHIKPTQFVIDFVLSSFEKRRNFLFAEHII